MGKWWYPVYSIRLRTFQWVKEKKVFCLARRWWFSLSGMSGNGNSYGVLVMGWGGSLYQDILGGERKVFIASEWYLYLNSLLIDLINRFNNGALENMYVFLWITHGNAVAVRLSEISGDLRAAQTSMGKQEDRSRYRFLNRDSPLDWETCEPITGSIVKMIENWATMKSSGDLLAWANEGSVAFGSGTRYSYWTICREMHILLLPALRETSRSCWAWRFEEISNYQEYL